MHRTLGRSVTRSGRSLHGGDLVHVELRPAPFGAGVVFVTPRGPVPATLAHARAVPGATVLEAGDARVSTPEHLLAALHALGVTDVEVALDSDELPALDGAAAEWVAAIDAAGRVDGPPLVPWEPRVTVEVSGHGGRARLGPGAFVEVEVAFESGPTGTRRVPLTEAAFRAEVMAARTFVLARDVDLLRAAGRGRGATTDNTVVWPSDTMRWPDEPVRHKVLDAWGDLALLGPCAVGLCVIRGSHALHLEVLRAARPTG